MKKHEFDELPSDVKRKIQKVLDQGVPLEAIRHMTISEDDEMPADLKASLREQFGDDGVIASMRKPNLEILMNPPKHVVTSLTNGIAVGVVKGNILTALILGGFYLLSLL